MDNPIQLVIIAILLVGVIFLGVAVIKSLVQPKKIDSLKKLIKAGKYSAAEKVAKAMLAKDPRDYMTHYYLGRAYLADKKNELALIRLAFDF